MRTSHSILLTSLLSFGQLALADEPVAPLSAAKGSLGLRVSLGAGSLPVYQASPGVWPPAPVGTVSAAYFVCDTLKLVGDVGFGLALAGGRPRVGWGVGIGAEYLFRAKTASLRPLLYAAVALNMGPPNDLNNEGQELPALEAQLGLGAEYFVSPHFSVSGRAGFGGAWRPGLGARAPAGAAILVGTIVPSIGATWYL